MNSKIYVGIDSGAKGAVAVIDDCEATVYDMPTLEQLMDNTIGLRANKGDGYRVAIESVHPLPGQSCTATFTYGQNFMLAKLIGLCYNSKPVMVSPQKWKNHYGLKRIKGESKTDYKKRSVDKARELFPDMVPGLPYSKDGRAEALLIAKWLKDTDENG